MFKFIFAEDSTAQNPDNNDGSTTTESQYPIKAGKMNIALWSSIFIKYFLISIILMQYVVELCKIEYFSKLYFYENCAWRLFLVMWRGCAK